MFSNMRKVFFLSVSLFLLVSSAGYAVPPEPSVALAPLKPTPVQEEAEKYISSYLRQHHFRRVSVNDSLSQEILSRYLDEIDNAKTYFLASDIERFKTKYGDILDDQFLVGKADAGFAIYNRFLEQARKKMKFVISLLDTARFDYSLIETFDLKRDDAPWPTDQKELHRLWRQEVKYQLLNMKYSGEEADSSALVLSKRYTNRLSLLDQQNAEDAFRVFSNAITTSFDPHTSYFSPMDFENFQIDMSRSLEGIGAKLQIENEYTMVNEVIPGGPAFKSKLLNKGDKIIGVGQGARGEIVDIVGWRINDVVHLIRGKKGSLVRLKILPVSQGGKGPSKIIQIVRDEVTLEEQSAQKSIVERDGRKIGLITVPAFYLDFEGQKHNRPDYKSTSRDVRKIIEELKLEGVQGIILDLRNNGGGALEEAVKLTGLFIADGPVVQIRNSQGGKLVLRDEEPDVLYSGPLAVLVNRYSASASEILAAAIQDYGRGIVIGGRTFGKGTVQSILNITRPFNFFYKSDDLGQLKLTVAKFYRITGESTQHLGVTPDLVFPSFIDSEVVGEDTYPSSLPWDKISPSDYDRSSNLSDESIERLRQRYLGRLATDSLYTGYVKDLNALKIFRKKDVVSLYEPAFKAEFEKVKNFEANWSRDEEEAENTADDKPDLMVLHAASVVGDMAVGAGQIPRGAASAPWHSQQ
ncbi:MAG: tail-specific protease [Prosthecochloris sp.]|uniref:Carboxyl-terminal protease n=2 Tax=Chlorobiaceae TaxID=191412 RepID=B4S7P8_PROA2|nr:carboxyl-terminal protease [Prosthecochloris aestuarii DSM 271]MCW8798154.1 tail-specific protease [Prosthecochloris sp.]RDD30401.1 tail-specific protease [Prosthecochloris sp. ZM]